ncbi:type VI secretion system membrane subunit TssM [Roseomonas sp. OT10]|uniref:type VI secretion system membrane subunit TssM n=1 Tax=Roseomonas cutis TaxID=2897332 RepID=UPI001E31BBC3|nr:type VI secretion system membrane subunit TssM [Roseomonas sp. OT10]UFN47770.1 type VI secretion system membrane subunit TssM [Roseomonas sp. OT10]
MRPLMLALRSVPGFTGLLAVLVLLPVIWLFAPLLGTGEFRPFEPAWARAALCLLVVLLYLGFLWWQGKRRQKRDQAIVETASAPDPTAGAVAEEEAALRGKLAEALGALRRTSAGKGSYLYELPWYVLIGPPGSGKTTAIARSGLEFPLAEGKVAGVGGTRNCDWWLSERAVMLDTAGRYTTQDSDAQADKAGWENFLGMLRRTRPRQPLNGVIVAFGVDMIAKLDPAQREAHARAVRRRIKELETGLAQRLPVYLIVTKADLLPGFVEMFDDLDRETRNQVWGFTFPVEEGPEGAAARFAPEFSLLLKRLNDRLLERLQTERGPAQRAAIAGFPAQLASLEPPLAGFVQAAFGGSRMDPAPFLRGVYLASGTQEGSPIDRLTGAMSRAFGLNPARAAQAAGQQGRSYFLGRLLKDVVFNEARLAARDRGAERRRKLVSIGAWSLAALVVLGGAAWAWTAQSREQKRAAILAEALSKAEQAAQGIPFDPVTDGELLRVLPYLDAARALPAAARAEGPGSLGFDQSEKLGTGGALAYRHALDRTFLPRLLARLEQQIRANLQRAEFLYEAVRVYLMLGRQGPMDAALVREWMGADWSRAYPGAVNQPQREALLGHLDALLAGDFATYPLDGALVDTARRVFSRLPMSERVYSRLRPVGQGLPPWRPADALGAAGQRFFVRASGKPLTEGVPGIYTVEGLYKALLPALPGAVREAASEGWVLGPEAAQAGAEDPLRLEAGVLALYAKEYGDAWQALLDDLVLPPFAGLQPAAEGLNLLGAPNSPLRDLLRGIARQLSPGTPPEGAAPAAQPGRAAAAQGAAEANPAEPVAQVVEARFRALREAAGQPLDDILRTVSELYVQVARLASAPPGTALPPPPAGGLDPGQRLLAEAARQPEPLAKWLRALAGSVQQARAGGAKAAIAAAGGQQIAPLCRGIEARFPFRRTGADIPVDDFTRLFAPGGVMDQFFAQNIRPYVDTTQNPWRPMATDGLAPPVTAADVAQFQRAQAIRDAFFPGVAGSGLRFELVPQGLDAASTAAALEAEGVKTDIPAGGSSRPILLGWPSRGNATLTFEPPAATGAVAFDGGWSSLRLVMGPQASMQPAGRNVRDRYRVTVTQGDRSAVFELRAGSSQNPFALPELAQFRCPVLAP